MAQTLKKIGIVICFFAIAAFMIFLILYELPETGAPSSSKPGNTTSLQISEKLPARVLLDNQNYYVHQMFNNCGEAALSMDLNFYGVHQTQQALADILRPDNNTTGKADDKSTPPDELAAYGETQGLVAYFRPNGSITLLKKLLSAGFPVMTRTLLNTSEDYAHYRVVKGYDDATGELTDEDGIQGENMTFSYNDFRALWKPFNNEYIVFAKPADEAKLNSVLGADADLKTAWQGAVETATQALAANAKDTAAELNLAVANYYTGNYNASAQAFEKAKPTLGLHALWYQLEPIESDYELGDYDQVFSLAQKIIADGNVAYPELYVVEGQSYLKQGNAAAAKAAFETALKYNKNLKSAQDGLVSVSNS